MKKQLFAALLSACVLFCTLLCACAGGADSKNTATLTGESGEFRYTLQSAETEYEASSLREDAPFDVTLTIEYTGDQDKIDLWCVDDLGSISMENKDGQALLSDEFHSRDTTRITLKKGTPYEIRWTGADEYREYGGIPAGDYTIVAYLNFSTDATYDSIQENTLDLSITVK